MHKDRYRVELKDEESGGLSRRTLMPDFFAGLSNSRMLSKTQCKLANLTEFDIGHVLPS
jgi:hypothetical protein